eukprot:SAG31_NODE_2021_length_6647_cov_2.271839_6_plen_115_part_00
MFAFLSGTGRSWALVASISNTLTYPQNRLLGNIFIANPKDSDLASIKLTVDGNEVEVKRSYNSRGLNHSRCFLGYYFDASEMAQDTPHKLSLTLPKLPRGTFSGIFWHNVETEY